MDTIELKNEFHNLIDRIEDEKMLEKFFSLMESANESMITESLWDNLPVEQRNEILLSEEESNSERNLISHEEMRKKYSKWL